MDKPDLADVLAEVNRMRAVRGMAPLTAMPKGSCSAFGCPLAIALHVRAVVPTHGANGSWSPYYNLRSGGEHFALPELLATFARAHDAGAYPELIA